MTFDELVAGVQRTTGCDHARAVEIVSKSVGREIPRKSPEEIERDERILEDEEQREISNLFRAYGFTVRSTSQKRPSKTSPDFPDLWVTRAARDDAPAFAFWFESKRQVGGKRTSGQKDFGDECIAAGVSYHFGDRYAAGVHLVRLGVAVYDGAGSCGISPKVRP